MNAQLEIIVYILKNKTTINHQLLLYYYKSSVASVTLTSLTLNM